MDKGTATVQKQVKSAAGGSQRIPLEQQSFEEHQLAILSHPLLPYVLRAINDVNGELTDYIPSPSVWQDCGADPEVTDFLLQYLKLVEAQNAAANRLQAQAVLYCSKAAEERIQTAKTDSISEVDSDIDSPVENASAQGATSSHKRTRSQSSLEDTNTRNQRLRTGSVDGGIVDHIDRQPVMNNPPPNNGNPSSVPINVASGGAQQKQPSPRMAAKIETPDEQRQSIPPQANSVPAMAQAIASIPMAQKPDQSMMYAPHQQWVRQGGAPNSNQPMATPAGFPTGPMQPNPAMNFYTPQGQGFYGRPNQSYVPMPNDPQQMMRQRQMGFAGPGSLYGDLPRSPNSSNSNQAVPAQSYMSGGYTTGYGNAPADMLRYGYMNPGSQPPNANLPMQRSMPLMNQLPNNSGMQISTGSVGQDANQSQNQAAQIQQARMQAQMQHAAAMQAQMQQLQGHQNVMGQGGQLAPQSGVSMAQVQMTQGQMSQGQQMQHRNSQPPPNRPPNY